MKGGNARRVGAAALALVCLVVGVGQASAEEAAPTLSVNDASAVEGSPVTFKITLSAAATEDVKVAAATLRRLRVHRSRRDGDDPKGQTSVDYAVTTQGNDLDQPDRVVRADPVEPDGRRRDDCATAPAKGRSRTTTRHRRSQSPVRPQSRRGGRQPVHGHDDQQVGVDVTVNYATANGTATAAS